MFSPFREGFIFAKLMEFCEIKPWQKFPNLQYFVENVSLHMKYQALFGFFNPFKPNEISLSYQLDQSISVLRVVGAYFSFLFKFG